MKKITILTLFPEMINEYTKYSIINIIKENRLLDIEIINFRDYSLDKHHKVDDITYGGGPGMVLSVQPIADCLKQIKTDKSKVVLLTPSGYRYDQKMANKLVLEDHLILICGHYEGIDERILNYVDYQISIGDYVLTGGELPALVLLDSIARLIPGSINRKSLEVESFDDYLLDYPVYTKPQEYDGYQVPEVLLSGNHKLIDAYRQQQRIIKTRINRPDLYEKYIEKKGIKNEGN